MSDGWCDQPAARPNETQGRLLRQSSAALDKELDQLGRASPNDAAATHSGRRRAHFVPGRIEVMGKHTDYAGGNSLLCATADRGIAMSSAMTVEGGEGGPSAASLSVTVLSVLPVGMEHHCSEGSTCSYEVEGRPVVRHTVSLPDDGGGESPRDWRVYPSATIARLHLNFDLLSCFPNGGRRHILISMCSNLPPASGLSTSSAIITGIFLVLDSHLNLRNTSTYREAIGEDENAVYNLSTYLGNVENGRDYCKPDRSVVLKGTVQGGVGTFGGSEDHAAILTGKPGRLRLLSFCPTRPASFSMGGIFDDPPTRSILGESEARPDAPREQSTVVDLPDDLCFVVAFSGARAEKGGDAQQGYNDAAELARVAARMLGKDTLAEAIADERRGGEQSDVKNVLGDAIRKNHGTKSKVSASSFVERFEQFYDESECLVPLAAYALSNSNYELLGKVVDASHRRAVNTLRNQIEETAWLALWARGLEDDLQVNHLQLSVRAPTYQAHSTQEGARITALAASAFGAGFGGSCWALLRERDAEKFARQWQGAYDARFTLEDRRTREFFVTRPGRGAFEVRVEDIDDFY